MSDPLLFTLAALALLLTPGPTNALLALAGAGQGLKASLPLLLAALTGYLLAVFLLTFGIGPLVAAYPALQGALRAACSLCLMVIAWRLWRGQRGGVQDRVTFAKVFIVTLLNPKALVFAFVLLPGPQHGTHIAGLSTLIVGAGLCWLGLGAFGGRLAGPRALLLNRAGALVLLTFSGLLVLPLLQG